MAEAFGVSRSPVREALRVMEAAGLVEALPNRGTYVRHIHTAPAIEVYGVRAALFGYAGQLVAERATDGERRELRGLHEAMSEAAASHSFEAYFPMNFAFHGSSSILAAMPFSRGNTGPSSSGAGRRRA